MNVPDAIDPCFHHLLAHSKKKRRNKKGWQERIQNELTLIETLSKSKWKVLLSSPLPLSISKEEMRQIEGMIYANCSSLRALRDQNRLFIRIVRHGNKHLGWEVALPRAVYMLPREAPLLAEHDFIELNFYRRLELRFEDSLNYIEKLSSQERIGQILFSAIARGALFEPWKQQALIESEQSQWVVEYLGSWVELKSLKSASKKKPAEELCEADYLAGRWFPDPLSESLVMRWFSDASDWQSLLVGGRIQIMLFAFLRRIGVPKSGMPKSISEFTRWASHSLALELPPYMHNISYGQPAATHISPESWLRVYSGKRVQKFDSSIAPTEVHLRKKTPAQSGGIVPLSEQFNYVESISKAALSKTVKEKKIEEIRSRLSSDGNEIPSLISWLIGMFILKLLEHGGREKKNLELSTIKRYISSIKAPLLNAFVDDDAIELSESGWLSLLQRAINDGKEKDQMSANQIAEFAQYACSLDGIPDFDVSELEGVSINKRVNANLVTHLEFEGALQLIPYGRRMHRMQRLAGALGFHLGLRSGETIHVLLKDIAGGAYPELLIRTNRYNRTKNRTSRRLPLHSLLPGKLFHEFMLFYRERMSEEKGKMGAKLLFCHPSNPTKPLSYDELISSTVEALKQVTGDQTLVYHNLRHSFANNTLIRLLLPEFPRIKCESIHMFKHEAFSMKSCIQLRQRLLPGTAKDVRTSVRDALYQLAIFMGHKSPSTTVTSYLHMFDWIIHRCLSDERVQLEDSAVRNILGIEGNYWHEVRRGLGASSRSEKVNTDKLLRYVGSKHISQFTNVAKRHVLSGIKLKLSSGYRNLVPTDLLQLLPMLFSSHHTIEEISEIMNLSPEDILQQKENAERLGSMMTRQGRPRFPARPTPIFGTHQHKDRALLLRKSEDLRSNDKHLAFGLGKFIHAIPATGMEVKLGKLSEVQMYIQFLRKLGIPSTRIILWHYPDSDASKSDNSDMRSWWSKKTGVPVNRIITKPVARAQKSLHPKRRIGWVSVFVREGKAGSKNKSAGVQNALHHLAIFNVHRLEEYFSQG